MGWGKENIKDVEYLLPERMLNEKVYYKRIQNNRISLPKSVTVQNFTEV